MTYLRDWLTVVENNPEIYDYYKNKPDQVLDNALDVLLEKSLQPNFKKEYSTKVYKVIQYIKHEREEE